MTEREEVLCRSGTALVVDLDRGDTWQGARVDEDHRQARSANVLDLGVVGGETDGDDAIDGGPPDRLSEGAVQGAR